MKRHLERYRASVLKAAVEGRLVPTEAELAKKEGRSYEPASELLKRILVERRRKWEEAELAKMIAKGKPPKDDRWKAKYVEPAAPETDGLPELPEGWCWTSLEACCSSLTDGDHLPPPQVESGVPFLVIGDVREGAISFESTRFVAKSYFDNLEAARTPRFGDILYTVTGSFGIPVPVNTDQQFCVQRHIAILRPLNASSADYLLYYLGSSFAFEQAAGMATGTAQLTVPLKGLRRMIVPLAPRFEQDRISNEVARLLSIGRAIARAVDLNRVRAGRFRQSILKWAFEGRLVDQDPSDEPASVLLERIRAERESATAKPKARVTRKSK